MLEMLQRKKGAIYNQSAYWGTYLPISTGCRFDFDSGSDSVSFAHVNSLGLTNHTELCR